MEFNKFRSGSTIISDAPKTLNTDDGNFFNAPTFFGSKKTEYDHMLYILGCVTCTVLGSGRIIILFNLFISIFGVHHCHLLPE